MTSIVTSRRAASDDDEQQALVAIAGLAPIAACALLVPLREHVAQANLAMILMAVVVLAALAGGRIAGAVAAATATMSFDFFLTRPYLSMRITSRDDIETAVILLVVGTLVGQFAARARTTRTARNVGLDELQRIHRLAELTTAGAAPETAIDACRRELTDLLDLQGCRFESAPYPALVALERDGSIRHQRDPIAVVRHARHGLELPVDGLEVPVVSQGQTSARFVLEPKPGGGLTREEGLVAIALVDQVGALLGQAHDA